ncbi:hypothetical protein T484DRAFT_1884091, partial [Baffinella frigidus]
MGTAADDEMDAIKICSAAAARKAAGIDAMEKTLEDTMVDSGMDHVKTTADRMRELEEDLQRLNEEYALELNLLTAPTSTLHSIGVPSSSMDRQPAGKLERKDSSSSDDEEIRRRVRANPTAAAPVSEDVVPAASTRWSLPKDGPRNQGKDEPEELMLDTRSREQGPASEADAGPANLATMHSAALARVDARLLANNVSRPGAPGGRRAVPLSPPSSPSPVSISRSELPGASPTNSRVEGIDCESSTGGLLPHDDEDDYLHDLRDARARVATRRGAPGAHGGVKLPPANAIEPLGSSRLLGPRGVGAPPAVK